MKMILYWQKFKNYALLLLSFLPHCLKLEKNVRKQRIGLFFLVHKSLYYGKNIVFWSQWLSVSVIILIFFAVLYLTNPWYCVHVYTYHLFLTSGKHTNMYMFMQNLLNIWKINNIINIISQHLGEDQCFMVMLKVSFHNHWWD